MADIFKPIEVFSTPSMPRFPVCLRVTGSLYYPYFPYQHKRQFGWTNEAGNTLKNPKVVPDFSDAALKYGKYTAYVATGGLSLVAEVIANKVTANQNVCTKILDGTVLSEAE